MSSPPQQRARRRTALACAVLWLLGFELLPGVHQALHDRLAPHHHGDDGERAAPPPSRVTLSASRRPTPASRGEGWHRHGGGVAHRHDPTAPHGGDHPHHPGAPSHGPAHGEGSLEHRGIAAVETPALDVPRAATVVAIAPPLDPRPPAPRSRAPRDRFVRGPPSVG